MEVGAGRNREDAVVGDEVSVAVVEGAEPRALRGIALEE